MKRLPRAHAVAIAAVGIAAALIGLVLGAGPLARPDLHDRVRLTPQTSGTVAGASGTQAALAPQPAPPCTPADLDAWQMPTPPDADSRHATLYNDHVGTKRAGQGQTLVPGVRVDSITPSQVTLVCAGEMARRQLTAPQPTLPGAPSARWPAPLGN